mmetsp:Transcript_28178/g.59664  ORF Transcript_28178/g.59664 Transcript_28178/m.59664 type:complete len:379 (+) Transcript_28178:626-1762(+)
MGIHLRHQELSDTEHGAKVVLRHFGREGAIREGLPKHIEGPELTRGRILYNETAWAHHAHGSTRGRHCRGNGHPGSGHMVEHDASRKLLREVGGDDDCDWSSGTGIGLLEGPSAEESAASLLEGLRRYQDAQAQEVHDLLPPWWEPPVRRVSIDDIGHEYVFEELLVAVYCQEGAHNGAARDTADDLRHKAFFQEEAADPHVPHGQGAASAEAERCGANRLLPCPQPGKELPAYSGVGLPASLASGGQATGELLEECLTVGGAEDIDAPSLVHKEGLQQRKVAAPGELTTQHSEMLLLRPLVISELSFSACASRILLPCQELRERNVRCTVLCKGRCAVQATCQSALLTVGLSEPEVHACESLTQGVLDHECQVKQDQ